MNCLGPGKPFGVHPSGTSIKGSGSARGFLFDVSEKLIRISGSHVDYLGHAQLVPGILFLLNALIGRRMSA
jgi:hypothetical protein